MVYTKKQIQDIIDDMVIIYDTREQKCGHILEYLDEIGVPYVRETVDVGDYTFRLPNYPELDLDSKFLVERKGSLDELAGNFTSGRDRFAKEFERMTNGQRMHLVLEDFTWRKCLNGSYRSNFHPNAFKSSLIAWSIKYNFKTWNVVKQDSGVIIYELLKKELEFALEQLSDKDGE